MIFKINLATSEPYYLLKTAISCNVIIGCFSEICDSMFYILEFWIRRSDSEPLWSFGHKKRLNILDVPLLSRGSFMNLMKNKLAKVQSSYFRKRERERERERERDEKTGKESRQMLLTFVSIFDIIILLFCKEKM